MTTIRPARTHDAAAIAVLCGQLGYPAGRQQVVVRLAAIESTRAACVLVVEDARRVVAVRFVEARDAPQVGLPRQRVEEFRRPDERRDVRVPGALRGDDLVFDVTFRKLLLTLDVEA